jgi:PAS domain S-box-containing protein
MAANTSNNNYKLWLVATLMSFSIMVSAMAVTFYVKHHILESLGEELVQHREASIDQYKLLLNDKKRLISFWAQDLTLYNTVKGVLSHSSGYGIADRAWHRLLVSIRRSEKLLGVEVLDRYGDAILTESKHEDLLSARHLIELDVLNELWRGDLKRVYASPPMKLMLQQTASQKAVPAIAILAPIKNEQQETLGLLAFYIDPHQISEPALNFNQIGQQGQSYAVDSDGMVLTHMKHTEKLIEQGILASDDPHPELTLQFAQQATSTPMGQNAWNQTLTRPISALMKQQSGVSTQAYVDYRGEKVIGAWTWDEELNMGFVTEAGYEEVFSTYVLFRNSVALGALIAILLAFITTEVFRRYHKRQQSTLELRNHIIDNTTDGMVVIDRASRIIIANPAMCRLFGYSQHTLEGRNIKCLIPEPTRSQHDDYIAHSELHGSRVFEKHRHLRGQRQDGSTFPIELTVTQMQIDNKDYYVGVLRDISGSLAREQALSKANSEAKEALALAESASKARSLFLSKMNHDLRTPLNAILGFTDLLLLDCDDPEQREHIDVIKSSGQQLLAMLTDVIDWAKAESGRIELELAPVHIESLIEKIMAETFDDAFKNDVMVSAESQEGNSLVLADAYRLKQVLSNLLLHAIQHNQSSGYVNIFITQDQEAQTVSLRFEYTHDERDEWLTQALLDLFQNLENIEANENADIKLILTRDLIYLMGGQIELESTAEKTLVKVIFRSATTSEPSLVLYSR